VLKYKGIYGHRLVHHSLGYACTKEVAEPKVEELLRTTGPGPYNQKSHAQVCEVFYFVVRRPRPRRRPKLRVPGLTRAPGPALPPLAPPCARPHPA
jgi:hypothetical protein